MPENSLRRLILWGCSVEVVVLLALCAVAMFLALNFTVFKPTPTPIFALSKVPPMVIATPTPTP